MSGVRHLHPTSPGVRHHPPIFVRTVKKLESALVALFALCGNEVPDMSAVMILRHGSKPLNVPPLRKAQYIVAAREGWAPAPTNDIQKAIWNRVMAEKAAATNAPSPAK